MDYVLSIHFQSKKVFVVRSSLGLSSALPQSSTFE